MNIKHFIKLIHIEHSIQLTWFFISLLEVTTTEVTVGSHMLSYKCALVSILLVTEVTYCLVYITLGFKLN